MRKICCSVSSLSRQRGTNHDFVFTARSEIRLMTAIFVGLRWQESAFVQHVRSRWLRSASNR